MSGFQRVTHKRSILIRQLAPWVVTMPLNYHYNYVNQVVGTDYGFMASLAPMHIALCAALICDCLIKPIRKAPLSAAIVHAEDTDTYIDA